MDNKTQAVPETGAIADAATAAQPVEIPQVGDVTPAGVIFGVRRFAEGGCEISFNGIDWQPAS